MMLSSGFVDTVTAQTIYGVTVGIWYDAENATWMDAARIMMYARIDILYRNHDAMVTTG